MKKMKTFLKKILSKVNGDRIDHVDPSNELCGSSPSENGLCESSTENSRQRYSTKFTLWVYNSVVTFIVVFGIIIICIG